VGVFSNLNGWEVIGLVLLGLFIFGPERLPKVIGDGLRMLRGLRTMARNATQDLSRELGTDVSLEDLHPKTFIRKHLLSDEEQAELRRPFDDLSRDMRQLTSDVNDTGRTPPAPRASDEPRPRRDDYDADAT
jgi:sec-independent protein translocase protein TatB